MIDNRDNDNSDNDYDDNEVMMMMMNTVWYEIIYVGKESCIDAFFFFQHELFRFSWMIALTNASASFVILKCKEGKIMEGYTFVHASFRPTELWKFPTSCGKFPAAFCCREMYRWRRSMKWWKSRNASTKMFVRQQ